MASSIITPGSGGDADGELAALDDLAASIEANADVERRLAARIRRLRSGRAAGRTWRELLAYDVGPSVVQIASAVLHTISQASGSLRRRVARGLRAEGATVPAIAETLEVSHQRVSTLLRR
jgi:hypothetical protein